MSLLTADQLVMHAIGDYVLQSDWMAINKTKRWLPAVTHALVYSMGFRAFTDSWTAMAVIIGTHYLIDRYRLARYVVWAKNWLSPGDNLPWRECTGTGYPPDRPAWMAVWLMIAADNIIHVVINGAAIKWL